MTQRRFAPVDEQIALLKRGAVDLVDESQLREKLARSRESGKPLTVKVGFDPSAPDLHLGHTVLIRKMKHFQDLGHRVIFLIGDFTGMIGDPSGRSATRPQLSADEVKTNSATYQRQIFHLLSRKETVIDYNSRWLGELGSEGVIQLAGRYTLARMLERDDFRTRLDSNQPISLHELLYPLLQGYDSIALEADVELGGHDQIFNLLVGRDLMKERGLEPQVVLTVPLLVGTDGVNKMSKSLGNAIAVEDTPRDIYGNTMSIGDDLMWEWFLLLTDVPEKEIDDRRRRVEGGQLNPMETKKELSRLLVTEYHDDKAALEAEAEFEKVFSKGGVPDEVPTVALAGPCLLPDLLTQAALAASKREARRLIEQGAVSIDGERVEEVVYELPVRSEPYLFKVGKRRFARVVLS